VNQPQQTFEVELPAGGKMYLQSPEEVELWERSAERYVDDYHLTKSNDLVLVGAILQQQISMFRAQRKLNGLEPQFDNAGVPTGQYTRVEIDADETDKWMKTLNSAADQVQKIEKSLGIDKVTREAGGTMSVENYLRTLKRAAHERGIHISKRVLAYEKFVNDFRWRLRVYFNADAEDRAYHNLTPDEMLKWCHEQLAGLEEIDKKFARDKGKVFAGKL
jgi:hypothetical protein